MKSIAKLSVVSSLLLLSGALAQAQTNVLSVGHTDLALDYTSTNDTWNLHVGSDTFGTEYDADEVILQVKAGALSTVPSGANFSFLGSATTPIWILPQTQNEDLLYLGYGGDGIPDGVFVGNQVTVTLKSVSGPGDFFSYKTDTFGNPVVYFNTHDGISTNDVVTVQAGGDAHLNWAFTAAGTYSVVIEASGTLVNGSKTTSSGPVTYSFTVLAPAILSIGHTDLALDYASTNDTWNLHVGSDTFGTEYAANEVILQVKGEAKTTVPSGPNFSFLGNAGDPIWILPQTQDENLLYLGYGGDGIPDGVFVGNQVTVTLKRVSGPGDFFSYKTDTFGNPVVYFNTHDGISTNDSVTVQAGGDAHLNWAFTATGTYSVAIEAKGTLANGNKVTSSGPVVYSFSVLAPIAQLTDEHADIQVLYDSTGTNGLSIAVRDVDHNVDYKSNEVYLVVKESSQLTLPGGTPFGNAGDILWIIPQSQNPDLLYLGLSAEGIAGNIFNGNLNFQLKALDGPGNMFVWQSDSSGNLHVYFNTADGITDVDSHSSIVGSHEHFNWGFTTNGVYEVTFQVSGQRFGETTNIVSPLTTFTFQVLPLPTNAPPATIQLDSPQLSSDASFSFSLSGGVNHAYEVQTTVDFVGWTTVTNLVPVTSPQTVTVPPDSGKPHRFFRVQAK